MATSAQISMTEYLRSTVDRRLRRLRDSIWIIDPNKRIGWDCTSGNWIRKDRFEAEASPIYLALDELFRQVDANEE